MHRKKINVSTVLTGQKFGIKEVEDGIWPISFMSHDLAYIGKEENRVESATNHSLRRKCK
ncbi:hypothetical protein [Roseibium sp.]|uniref:hypothetical protein n=1 Tax=Roseibium sp. TaxID=1936156 RepID=UPI003BB1B600